MKLRSLFFLGITVMSAPAQDQNPAPADPFLPANVMVQIDWIQMPHLTANQLIRQHLKHTRESDALYNAAKELVAQKKAARLDFTSFVVRAGQRSKTESILEKPWPTEFTAPGEAQKKAADGKAVAEREVPALPASFDTRNLGRSAEVEVTVGEDQRTIDLNLWTEWVDHIADISWGTGLNEVKQPVFGAGKFTAQLLEDSGSWQLAALLTPPHGAAEGKPLGRELPAERVLVFVRATVAGKKPPGPAPATQVHQVLVLAEWIETGADVAAELMAKFPASADSPELREAFEPMLTDGRAALLESSAIQVRGGQRSRVESITEYPVPLKFAPGIPQTFGGQGPLLPPNSAAPGLIDQFTLQNLGATVEAEVTVSESGRAIDMNIAPELGFNAGTDSYGQGISEVKRQRFQILRISSQVLLPVGVPSMIGSFDAPLLEGKALPAVRARKVLLFVRGIL